MIKVVMPIADGFEEIEAVALIDVLRRAKIDVTVAYMNTEMIKGAHEIVIQGDRSIEEIRSTDFDMVLLPGGMKNTRSLSTNPSVQDLLKEMNKSKKVVGAICAAPLALHTAGVLSKSFTCYPGIEEEMRGAGVRSNDSVVISENIMTSQGPGTAILFGLQIVKKLAGEARYQEVKEDLLAE